MFIARFLFAVMFAFLTLHAGAQSGSMTPRDMYEQIQSIERDEAARFAAEVDQGKHPWELMWQQTDASKQKLELQRQLSDLAEKNQGDASFFWGLLNLENGTRLIGNENAKSLVAEYFSRAEKSLRRASNSGFPAAAWNLALMYQNGWGVMPSRLVAVEWFAKAGDLYLKTGDREMALSSLERAEDLDSANPAAKRLRAKLLK